MYVFFHVLLLHFDFWILKDNHCKNLNGLLPSMNFHALIQNLKQKHLQPLCGLSCPCFRANLGGEIFQTLVSHKICMKMIYFYSLCNKCEHYLHQFMKKLSSVLFVPDPKWVVKAAICENLYITNIMHYFVYNCNHNLNIWIVAVPWALRSKNHQI